MEITDFILKFGEIFDDTDISSLRPETKFRELEEWSSLSALSVLAMVDEEYDIQLKADEMRKTNTIKELFDLINGIKNK